MKKTLDLPYAELLEIHHQYQKLGSLEKTARWVQEKLRLNVNRHDLAWKFKTLGFDVKPPNGREVTHWRDNTSFKSSYARIAADMVQLAVDDMLGYKNNPNNKIEWMSAGAFITGELWETCLGTLLTGAQIALSVRALPAGITEAEVLEAATLYNRGYQYWVNSV